MAKPHRTAVLLIALALAAGPAIALPPPPSAEQAKLIGQYGSAEAPTTVYEDGGRLFIDGGSSLRSPIYCHGLACNGDLQGDEIFLAHFEARRGRVTALDIGSQRLPRRDFGAEVVAAIQANLRADPKAARAAALAATPPKEPTPKRPSDLVDLTTVDPAIKLDVHYATANNFMGFPLYERAGAYLQRPAAEALGRAQKALAAQGYGLLIHDAYRPWFVTKMFWDATPPEDHVFVADPAQGSRHNRGCAVDLTLYDLKTGQPVEMTGRYDEMSTRSYADFPGGTSRQRALRAILRTAMEAQGFAVYPQEWWHFDYKDYASYGIGTVTFTELAQRR